MTTNISITSFAFKVKLYAKHTGKTPEQIEADIRRPKYFSPSEAVEYGIIDKVHSAKYVKFIQPWFSCFAEDLLIFCRYCTTREVLKTTELFLT